MKFFKDHYNDVINQKLYNFAYQSNIFKKKKIFSKFGNC